MGIHDSHYAILKRLRRANGHLGSVIRMIEAKKDCVDVAQQLQAVEKAVSAGKKVFIQDHIDHCINDRLSGTRKQAKKSIVDLKKISKYL